MSLIGPVEGISGGKKFVGHNMKKKWNQIVNTYIIVIVCYALEHIPNFPSNLFDDRYLYFWNFASAKGQVEYAIKYEK